MGPKYLNYTIQSKKPISEKLIPSREPNTRTNRHKASPVKATQTNNSKFHFSTLTV